MTLLFLFLRSEQQSLSYFLKIYLLFMDALLEGMSAYHMHSLCTQTQEEFDLLQLELQKVMTYFMSARNWKYVLRKNSRVFNFGAITPPIMVRKIWKMFSMWEKER